LTELVYHSRPAADANAVTLDQMVRARVSRLPEPSRHLLEVVAVASQPVESQTAWKSTLRREAPQSAMAPLRAQRLVRLRRGKGTQEIEVYHDRIREIVEQSLPDALRAGRHLSLAVELEKSGRAGPDRLAVHFRQGGDSTKAFTYSVAAAEQASHS